MKKIYSSFNLVVTIIVFTSFKLLSQCNVISNVPYLEDFQGITANNTLPNCSWLASNLGNTCLTYTVGTKNAAFFNSPAGVNYFYTNGIQLKANVIYSLSVWYKTDNNGGQNWTDLSLFVCPNQSATGAVSVASSNGPASSPSYLNLNNTFTVSSSGVYYIAVRGTGSAGNSPYLYWDDLQVTVPCSGVGASNSPTITVNPGITATLCAGKSATLIANGANTYTWSNNATTSSIVITPSASVLNSVSGTNTLTGCMSSTNLNLTVLPSPVLSVLAPSSSVCSGNSVSISVLGASSYTWSDGSNSSSIAVTPSISTNYSVTGSNVSGCSATASVQINVNQLPTISAVSSVTAICLGESAVLNSAGGLNYQWFNQTQTLTTGNQITVSPSVSTTYSVVGTDINGCSNSDIINLTVNTCLGINNIPFANNYMIIYPNPNNGNFTIESTNENIKQLSIVDLTGRIFLVTETENQKVKIDISDIPDGIYFAKVKVDGKTNVLKIVKR